MLDAADKLTAELAGLTTVPAANNPPEQEYKPQLQGIERKEQEQLYGQERISRQVQTTKYYWCPKSPNDFWCIVEIVYSSNIMIAILDYFSIAYYKTIALKLLCLIFE